LTARANEQRLTFRDARDREHFLELLAQWVDRFRLRLHAYVLMPNHYHLLAETTMGSAGGPGPVGQPRFHGAIDQAGPWQAGRALCPGRS